MSLNVVKYITTIISMISSFGRISVSNFHIKSKAGFCILVLILLNFIYVCVCEGGRGVSIHFDFHVPLFNVSI